MSAHDEECPILLAADEARWQGGCAGGCRESDLHDAADGATRCRRCGFPLGGTPTRPSERCSVPGCWTAREDGSAWCWAHFDLGEGEARHPAGASTTTPPEGTTPPSGPASAARGGAAVYVASRASVPERPAMWQRFRADGFPICSTWIDEAEAGQTASMAELWERIGREVAGSCGLLLYVEESDLPLKGAFVEAGMALAHGLPVAIVAPGVADVRKAVGSWVSVAHVFGQVEDAFWWLLGEGQDARAPGPARCPATNFVWTCARPADHDGPHVHCGLADASTCARWVEGAQTDADEEDDDDLDAYVMLEPRLGGGWAVQGDPLERVFASSDEAMAAFPGLDWRPDGDHVWCASIHCGTEPALLRASLQAAIDALAAARRENEDLRLRVALWSGAPVEGWERVSAENGGGYRRAAGNRTAHVYVYAEGPPWRWVGSEPAGWVRERGSDPDPLVCLRAAEAWAKEVARG